MNDFVLGPIVRKNLPNHTTILFTYSTCSLGTNNEDESIQKFVYNYIRRLPPFLEENPIFGNTLQVQKAHLSLQRSLHREWHHKTLSPVYRAGG